ncbi:MAG: NAD-dependent epimerase/dehydratase family protein [Planctomycetota bacterium]
MSQIFGASFRQEILSPYKECRTLVTGGLGFVGSHMARALVQAGAHVTILDARVDGLGANDFNIHDIRDRVRLIEGRLGDAGKAAEALTGCTHVFNLAGQVSHIDSMTHPLDDLELNYSDHLTFLETLRHVCPQARVVYAGTRQVYGAPKTLPIREDHIVQPVDLNGISKYAAEWAHILYHRVYGVQACSLRLTNTYGPGQLIRHNRQGFLPWFVRRAVEGQEIELYGGGTQTRDLNHVSDVVEAFLLAAMHPNAVGGIFNLGHRETVSLEAIATTLQEFCPQAKVKKIPFPDEKKRIDLGSTQCDFTKIQSLLGWSPRVMMKDGLRQMAEFYQSHLRYYLP